jgi:predicted metal-binding membrane protein
MWGERAMLTWRANIAWRHPEWWILALSGAAWIYMLAGYTLAWPVDAVRVHDRPHAAFSSHTLLTDLRIWLVMIDAMMVPLATGPVRAVAVRSLWRRRHRAMMVFVAGYVAVWLIAGGGVALARSLSAFLPDSSPAIAAGGFLLAAVWHALPVRRRALASCHFTRPIAPTGWKADADCLRYGCVIGGRCVVSCWALMLACVLARHNPLAMLGTATLMVMERFAFRPRPHLAIAALVLMALVCVTSAVP